MRSECKGDNGRRRRGGRSGPGPGRGDQDLGIQRLAPRVAEAGRAPDAQVERPHAGGGVQRLMFVTYLDIEDQRRDEGLRYAEFLAHRTGALALQSAEDEDRHQRMSHMHYVRRQGLQWEWQRGCKGMEWGAERRRLKLQALEKHARWELEREACSSLETYCTCHLARQRYWCQRRMQGLARSLAQWAGQLPLECECRDRVVREGRQRWVALGVSQVREAEATGRRGLQTAAMGGLGLLQAFVRGEHLILQHAAAHGNTVAGAHQQAARAIQVRATQHVLHTEGISERRAHAGQVVGHSRRPMHF